MREHPRRAVALVSALAVACAAVLAWVVTGPDDAARGPRAASSPAPSGTGLPAGPDLTARFVDAYVDPDGRVVRRDQGGDTVSEGQAYAMLLAVADRDEATFDRVWDWTERELVRPDGLLSWTWRDGAVVDANSAADADVDAAHALVVAGDAFERPDLRAAGGRLATAILDHETRTTPLGRVLVGGQWADAPPYRVNPSYASPAAYEVIGRATGDRRWTELADGDRAVLGALLDEAPLPPDWAQVTEDGRVEAMPPSGGGSVGYGLDAQRVALRYAASCEPADRGVVRRLGAAVRTDRDDVRGVYDLGGTPTVAWQHPLALTSAAAVSGVDGDARAGSALLADAATLDERSSTYYGAAWVALGEQLLTDPRRLGVDCEGVAS
ncbi:glycosyl hydrolase family 8 [Phycicoccus sonneratiae]|uniref:Glycoside hydrolase n=1 Tax=Phycicoccus sonneratiae TaxID=2807628 RepID=A0ABS2CFY3_9MICO|nr:glycosyl hydrolase family 8 [Phycicoccus sonneraticus]MBM6398779.1 hypothetical protein [Phycicoccus sonneraticus]